MDSIILLLIILLLAIISKNTALIYAVIIIFIIKMLPNSDNLLKIARKKSILIGITILCIYILSPIADGSITSKDLIKYLYSPIGIIAILIGILASILSTKGIYLQSIRPEITVPLMLGTIIGIVFFKGTASGPIVAGGITYFVIILIELFYKIT